MAQLVVREACVAAAIAADALSSSPKPRHRRLLTCTTSPLTIDVEPGGVLGVTQLVVSAAGVAPAVRRRRRAHVQHRHHVAVHRRLFANEVPMICV